jgi:NitT/TauT family transport system substrate-binding protein
MKVRKFLTLCTVCLLSFLLSVSCNSSPQAVSSDSLPPLVIGYSNWPGWLPWAIAEEEGLFKENGVQVKLQWYDNYLESLKALAAGKIDANCQTLNDTIAFAGDSVNGQVTVLVNDNSAGNDKIIVADEINSVEDLKGKTVAIEEGVVDDFLLSLGLQENGLSRQDIKLKNMGTEQAAAAFVARHSDGVGAFAPFWLDALKRPDAKELFSSKDFPGAIPDLLVVTQKLNRERPQEVQALVKTWFATLDFMAKNPEKAEAIMAKRGGVSVKDFQLFKKGTKIFTLPENLAAFQSGDNLKHLNFTAEKISEFLVDVGLLKQVPNLNQLFDDRYVKNL